METGFLRIDHRDPKCAFQIKMTAGGESLERAWESCLSSGRQTGENGIYSQLLWEADVLVFDCGSKAEGGTWNMVWRYRLLDEGRRLQADEQMRGRGDDFDNIWLFDKA